ncbi:ribonuclease R [Murimonas intestini]|uniref:ribonuclease R n=1 Tax=Murimonas intestini TaxID=1337051 RepID=UPI0011DD9475|nr:ribonuclease R [Murimonas intestini]
MKEDIFEKRKKVIYDLICDEHYIPMKVKELAILLQVTKEERPSLQAVLDELVKEGKIEVSKRGKYKKLESPVLVGTFIGNQKGFGFVEIEGAEEDIFIPESGVNGALHQDTVQVALVSGKPGKRREGEVVRVLARGITEVVGTYQKSKNFGFVVPDSLKFTRDIFIPIERSKGAVDGHKVLVEITDYGSKNKKPEGKVKKIIGHINDPGTDILSIVYAYDLPVEFSDKIMHQAENVSNEVSEADMAGRMDIRDWQIVTIDGEDAKDLDDGVSLTKEGDIYHLGVHIADVSNYVQENSALDREALKRGTSVYLVDRVIPMLPHKLSNGICSLNEGVDRLALSCIMDIDGKGNVTGHQIAETVIKVDRRMTYTSVKKILEDRDSEETAKYEKLVPMFEMMQELAAILRKKRRQRGSIDFDFPETKIILDKEGHPLEIKPYDRNVATKIIEDFMLIANETVAQDYYWQELPFVYRTHDNPDPEKIQQLALFINNFGYAIKNTRDEIHPKELQKLLARIEDSPEETLISRLTLRSMKRASYTVECTGHFGLAAPYYCHFTSPIRRYPDLQIHRIIKENLRGKMNEGRIEHYQSILQTVADQSSKLERRADEAERETEKLKKAEYMENHIGETFEGVISSITSWGMYVELSNTIEGMIHVTNMYDDRYYYREETHEMFGVDTGKVYKLGQKVRIRVLGADKHTRSVDFEMAAEDEEEQP